jgi:hypothetical protein
VMPIGPDVDLVFMSLRCLRSSVTSLNGVSMSMNSFESAGSGFWGSSIAWSRMTDPGKCFVASLYSVSIAHAQSQISCERAKGTLILSRGGWPGPSRESISV